MGVTAAPLLLATVNTHQRPSRKCDTWPATYVNRLKDTYYFPQPAWVAERHTPSLEQNIIAAAANSY